MGTPNACSSGSAGPRPPQAGRGGRPVTTHAVAYVNEDDVTQGPRFGGGGSPSLKSLIRDAARVVPDPAGRGSVYDAWLERNKGDTAALTLGNLGGGSDFAAFYHHLGIPAAAVGVHGPGGGLHPVYRPNALSHPFRRP